MQLPSFVTDLPFLILLPIAVFVLTMLVFVLSRAGRKSSSAVTDGAFDDRARIFDTSPLDDTPDSYLSEKRRSLRREGNWVPVKVSQDPDGHRIVEAVVVDRSKSGLKIYTTRAVKQGTVLCVKAENAPEGTPWVFVQVCRVTRHRKYHELGCQFTQEVPWNLLLLFG